MRHAEIPPGQIGDEVAFRPGSESQQETRQRGHGKGEVIAQQQPGRDRGQAQQRKRDDALPEPVEQRAGDQPPGENADAQYAHHARRGFRIDAAQPQHGGHVDERPAESRRDQPDRQPDHVKAVILQRRRQRHARQRAGVAFDRLGPFVGAGFAEQEKRRDQRRGGEQRHDGEHRTPAVALDRFDRDARDDHRGDAGAHQQDAERQPAIAVEPQVDRAAPRDRGRSDADEPDNDPETVVDRKRLRAVFLRGQRYGGESEAEGEQ